MNPPANANPAASTFGARLLARTWKSHPRLTGIALGAVALAVLLLLFLRFALPGIAIAQAERLVDEKLHRHLVIERIEIHPLALAVSIQGARLLEADNKSVFAQVERLDLRVSAASLTHLAPVVRELRLVKPYIHVTRVAPHRFSTDDIVAALNSGPPSPPRPPDAPLPRFSVNNIQIDGGHFVYDDTPRSTHHEISAFTLGLPFVSTFAADEEVFVDPHLSATVDGAALHVLAQARPFAPTREAAVDLDVDGLDLTRYDDYLPEPLPVQIASARLDLHLKLKVTLARDHPPALAVAGQLRLHDLDLRSPRGQPMLKLAAVDLAIDKANVPSGPLAAVLTVNQKGRIAVDGETALSPLHARLAVQVDNLDLLPLQPLFSDRVNLRVTRAGLDAKADLQLDQDAGGPLRGMVAGNAALKRLATIDSVNTNDFVSWENLALRGVRVQLAPLALRVDQLALDKLYARVIIAPNGRINLQDIVKQGAAAKVSLTEAPAAPAAPVEAPAAAPPAPAGPAGPPMSIGKVLLTGGHVRFSDNFIKPRYSADLLDLHGSIEGLSSDPASTASVDVHGIVNDAPLLIGGRVNPLARDLALDIKASVHDMELAPLSPYSGKYVGYRIERGKLSFDVAYQLASRQLQAQNKLVLDQLTFGDRVESASATTLPVQLAVALLRDRNGVIDIDLPIGGSLDDPQFSIGGVIVKVLINLITKAVTAPFALLGNLFGGGSEQMSSLAFDPGLATIPEAREPGLKALAKAMAERPGLKLDITGWVDSTVDRDALRRLRVDARLRALKRADLAARGALVTNSEVAVAPAEYPDLLKRLYQRDVVAAATRDGAARTAAGAAAPTPGEMEQALRAAQQISDDDLRALGNRRAQAAKDWLRTIGLVPEDRLSLVAAKIVEPAGPQDAAAPAPAAAPVPAAVPAPATASTSRVEFGLR